MVPAITVGCNGSWLAAGPPGIGPSSRGGGGLRAADELPQFPPLAVPSCACGKVLAAMNSGGTGGGGLFAPGGEVLQRRLVGAVAEFPRPCPMWAEEGQGRGCGLGPHGG